MKLIYHCPICQSKTFETKSFTIGKKRFSTLNCGHNTSEDIVEIKEEQINGNLLDGRVAYPFQVDGIKFIKESGFRCLIADEMGLGKTIQVVQALNNFREEMLPMLVVVKASLKIQWARELFLGAGIPAEILDSKSKPIGLPINIVSYDSLRNAVWKNDLQFKTLVLDECQMIKNHNSKRTQEVRDLASGRRVIKIDNLLDNKSKSDTIKRAEMIALDLMKYHGLGNRFTLDIIKEKERILGKCKVSATKEGIIVGKIYLSKDHIERDSEEEVIDTILHEIAHAITPGAGHKPIWSDTAKAIGSDGQAYAWCNGSIEDKIEYVEEAKNIIATSGTPIKNNAGEYFPILNLLYPKEWPNFAEFARNWTDSYFSGYGVSGYKIGGLRNPEQFKEKTKRYIIRRERKEVLPDLPAIRRNRRYCEMNEIIGKKYQAEVKDFQDYMTSRDENESAMESSSHLLAYMNRMRHLTGFAKIPSIVSYVEDFLESEEDEKITIFMHHKDVQDLLEKHLYDVIEKNEKLKGSKILRLTSEQEMHKRQSVIDEFRENKLNRIMIAPTLACGEGLNLQFCSTVIIGEREWNPSNEEQAEGRFSRIGSIADSIEVTYSVAIGSIDELFAEYVERKRQYFQEAMTGKKSEILWNQSSIITEIAEELMSRNLTSWKRKLVDPIEITKGQVNA